MTERITISLDEDLKERIDEVADEEGITTSQLVRRSVKQRLEQGSLESRLSELENRVAEAEKTQNRSVSDRIANTLIPYHD